MANPWDEIFDDPSLRAAPRTPQRAQPPKRVAGTPRPTTVSRVSSALAAGADPLAATRRAPIAADTGFAASQDAKNPKLAQQLRQNSADRASVAKREDAKRVDQAAPVSTKGMSVSGKIAAQGGLGFSDETRSDLYGNGMAPVRNLFYGAGELGFMALQGAGAVMEVGAEGLDDLSDSTGLSDLLSMGGNRFQPGTAIMALGEAFPMGFEGAVGRASIAAGMPKELRRASKSMRFDQKLPDDIAPPPAIKAAEAGPAKAAAKAEAAPAKTAAMASDDAPMVKTADIPEDRELFQLDELNGDPDAARRAMTERVNVLTADEAKAILNKIQENEINGTPLADPRYRSLLKVDISDIESNPDRIIGALNVFEDGMEELFERANLAPQTMKEMDRDFLSSLGTGGVKEKLIEAYDQTRDLVRHARTAQHSNLLAGVKFMQAREQLLPGVLKGEAGARTALVESLIQATQAYSMGKAVKSELGRAMRSLQGEMAVATKGELMEVPNLSDVRKSVNDAIRHLDDQSLAALLNKMKSAENLGDVVETLTDPSAAQTFTAFHKVRNSVSAFMRSNAFSPVTGMVNAVSAVMNDLFRNDFARAWQASKLSRDGFELEALGLEMELKVGRAVYWTAQREGLKALLDRIKWDTLGSAERVFGTVAGNGKLVRGVRKFRSELLTRGYAPPVAREATDASVAANRLTVSDLDGFNARLADRAEQGGAFARLLNGLERAGAGALNSVDALGNLGGTLFVGAVDDWGRAFVTMKETHSRTARWAVRQAIEEGLTEGDDIRDYVMDVVRRRADMPPSSVWDEVQTELLMDGDVSPEVNMMLHRARDVEKEADRVLFMDGPQTDTGRKVAAMAEKADSILGLGMVQGLFLPFVRTPTRLAEVGLVRYTPWARQAEEVRTILAKGGPEAEIVKAQIELSSVAMAIGFSAAAAGAFTVTNGSFENSRNLDAGPALRINLPGGVWFEVGRLDPFSVSANFCAPRQLSALLG